ncbi:MAG: protein involved in polysaccharide export with SLBB domain [Candidatus Krumholzibacteriia bacterium]|jgi:protein involved in polysaccharide export with SLBB domain
MTQSLRPGSLRSAITISLLVSVFFLSSSFIDLALSQEFTPEMLEAASQQTGLSKEELMKRYAQQNGGQQEGAQGEGSVAEPGRTSLDGIDDSMPPVAEARFRDSDAQVVLPFSQALVQEAMLEDLIAEALADSNVRHFYGDDFFQLDAGVFTPPSFGPVSSDHRLGVGDEVVINVWGGVDLQLVRIVDRDGSIILPRVGKISCAGRTLDEIDGSIRERLAQSHSSIDTTGEGDGDTFVEVTLGHLRAIRVFVVGQAVRPGSYELSSVSTVLTALYAAAGPSDLGTYRNIEVVRGGTTVGTFDLYTYLMGGSRAQDITLQEGDTVFIGDRSVSVEVEGSVRRPMYYEMRDGESLSELISYAGGFSATAAPSMIHIKRILPPALRQPGKPDHVFLDVAFDAAAMTSVGAEPVIIMDGDEVLINSIGDRIEGWVEVVGSVKRPGKYQYREGMSVADLLATAEGLWPDALTERAVIDRTNEDLSYTSVAVPLGKILSGEAPTVLLQKMDVLHVFARWDTQIRPTVKISGEVFQPLDMEFREGMTLRDLILRAGGLKESADWVRAEVARLQLDSVRNPDTTMRPEQTTKVLIVNLGADFLTAEESFVLQAYDQVAIRRLPWWEMQETVKVRGEVFYPGEFSLERKDERLSSMITRAGGLQPGAYLVGARVVRSADGVGNIALDLEKALAEPGSQYDIILQDGDEIVIPDQMFTVKVVGEVGFPTSLIWEEGKKIDYYVDRAGGYLEKADDDKARVVWPNGMSLPNKGGSKVVAGSTIVVPLEPPPEGKTTIETIRDITGIVASLAMVWLVIENTK